MATKKIIDRNLTDTELTAIAKAGKSGAIAVGDHPVDVTIRVQATIRKGEDYDRAGTVNIPLKDTMAYLLHRLGFNRDNAVKAIVEAMNDAINNKKAVELDVIDKAAELVTKAIKNIPRVTVKGPVTVHDMIVTKVEPMVVTGKDIEIPSTATKFATAEK